MNANLTLYPSLNLLYTTAFILETSDLLLLETDDVLLLEINS